MKLHLIGISLIVLGLQFLPSFAGADDTVIGRVAEMSGSKLGNAVAPGGSMRNLSPGDPVFAGERIRTGEKTTLRIEFSDKSRFTLGPDAEFEVLRYQHARKDSEEEAFYSRVLKGAFRFVSGLVASRNRKSMEVSVTVATIGIRGTHVEGEVTERREVNGKIIDSSAKVVLLEPEDEDKQTAIIVENEYGSVIIDEPGYGTEIPDEKSPPSPVKRMKLRTIDNLQRTLRNVRPRGPARRP